ncbi:helix-turn-helix transcriptional regulator [Chitinophaga defluvii]|uniref:AraC family transcriptional regulator n=1 Tax=Chitinophaga defluvii TaxID=3163343 RepID=A0ABV2SYR5_9BACT
MELEKATYLGTNTHSYYADGILISETAYHRKVFEGWHSHQHPHITFIIEGGNQEQRKHREQEVRPGEVLLYHSGERHRNKNTQHPSRNINFEIESSFLDRYELDFSSLYQGGTSSPGYKAGLLKIYRECCVNDVHTVSSIHALLLELFNIAQTPGKTTRIPQWAIRLQQLLHDTWDDTPSLTQLAAILQVHPVTISKYFPVYFSCTLGEYIRRIKVEKAVAYIKEPGSSLTEIAYRCGFTDQSHFIRTFRTATGFLPGEYKKM